MERTTAKLRKTFRYPTDHDSDDDLPSALDEEEQDKLIQTLHEENTLRNKQYALILLALPLLCIPAYIPSLLTAATSLLALLSISSLLTTAYLVHILPPPITAIAILDSLNAPQNPARRGAPSPLSFYAEGARGPVLTYLPAMNAVLCALLGVLGLVFAGKHEVWWGFGWVPAFVWAVVVLGKVVMAGVNPAEELGGLRYEFKGA